MAMEVGVPTMPLEKHRHMGQALLDMEKAIQAEAWAEEAMVHTKVPQNLLTIF
jgi:hypothetical protein